MSFMQRRPLLGSTIIAGLNLVPGGAVVPQDARAEQVGAGTVVTARRTEERLQDVRAYSSRFAAWIDRIADLGSAPTSGLR